MSVQHRNDTTCRLDVKEGTERPKVKQSGSLQRFYTSRQRSVSCVCAIFTRQCKKRVQTGNTSNCLENILAEWPLFDFSHGASVHDGSMKKTFCRSSSV